MKRLLCVFATTFIFCSCGNWKDKGKHPDVQSRGEPVGAPTQQPTQQPQPTPTQQPTQQPIPIQQEPTDDIYGTPISRSDSWRVERGVVYDKGTPTKLNGLNWFGFETGDLVVHGLWTGRSMESYLDQIDAMGFTSLRIPLAPQVFDNKKPLSDLTRLVVSAEERGLSILLDLHNCSFRENLKGNPAGCSNYNLESWYTTLGKMATFANEHPNVLGIDIFNEPHALSWKSWRALATEAGKRILSVNPRILVFVEGVSQTDTDTGGWGTFWGENMVEAGANPPAIPKSRLVLSPHVYGPSVFYQQYFNEKNFPDNMPRIWDVHFGYLVEEGYTVVMGEFGGRYVDKDKVWADKFVDYLIERKISNFYYWALNPNSGDTGGVLQDNWQSVNQAKLDLLKKMF